MHGALSGLILSSRLGAVYLPQQGNGVPAGCLVRMSVPVSLPVHAAVGRRPWYPFTLRVRFAMHASIIHDVCELASRSLSSS
jgi:hypothetical protein